MDSDLNDLKKGQRIEFNTDDGLVEMVISYYKKSNIIYMDGNDTRTHYFGYRDNDHRKWWCPSTAITRVIK